MSKHFNPAYSLWPEQVERRRSMSLTFAVRGGFVFGLVCVSTAYDVISDFVSSLTGQDPHDVTEGARGLFGGVCVASRRIPSRVPAAMGIWASHDRSCT